MTSILRTRFNHLPVNRQSCDFITVQLNKGMALLNFVEAPSSLLHVRKELEKPALVQRGVFFLTFTLQKKKVLFLFKQPHTEAGTISNIDTFGALLINVPTTAIILLQYAEHSNVFFCLLLLKK